MKLPPAQTWRSAGAPALVAAVLGLVGVAPLVLGSTAPAAAASPPQAVWQTAVGPGPALGAYQPISGTRPYPPRPISGTVIVGWPYPYPYWCLFPNRIAPPLPPGMPTPLPPTPVPSPTPGGAATAATYTVCPHIRNRVPLAVQQQALAQPWTVYGFNERHNPNVPGHPLWNTLRTELNLWNPNVPYSECNPVVWKSGCW